MMTKLTRNTIKKFMPSIKKRRRKSDHCLNCGKEYSKEYNYCPKCGQENNHNVASFRTVIVDFFHNYFSFDSKFSNSLLPFFFKPGLLTQQFIEGKRASFVNPIRLYLILSLVFFFVFSLVSQDFVNESVKTAETLNAAIPDSTQVLLNKNIEMTMSELERDSTAKKYVPNISLTDYKQWEVKEYQKEENDVWGINLETYLKIRKNHNLQVQQVIDSLETDSLTEFHISMMKQVVRLDRAEKEIVISHVLKNLPLMMFIIIPIFALVLKIFYIRSGQYYITHLVHALHLHSLAYVFYGLVFLVTVYWLPKDGPAFTLIFLSWVLVCTHSYISFLKVYDQHWKKTLLKYNMVGFIYTILLFIGILVELLFSVVTY